MSYSYFFSFQFWADEYNAYTLGASELIFTKENLMCMHCIRKYFNTENKRNFDSPWRSKKV